MRGVKR